MVKFETQVYHKKEKGEDVVGCTVTCMDEKGSVIGEIHVLPVNELNELQERVKALDKKFNNYYTITEINDKLKELKDNFVTETKLTEKLGDYATTKALDVTNSKVEALSENSPLIGRITKDEYGKWDYDSISGLKDQFIYHTSKDMGLCVVIPPAAYTEENEYLTALLNYISDKVSVKKADITKASENEYIPITSGWCYTAELEKHYVPELKADCLVGIWEFRWKPGVQFDNYVSFTTNWKGKSVTRILLKQPESSSNEEKLIMY